MNVLTYHNDIARTGQNLNETILTPANVNSNSFGLLFTCAVDGYVYAQPLYVANLMIPGKGTHNVVYVATEHNSVYAFDADNNQGQNAEPLWVVSFSNPEAGITAVPISDFGLTEPPEIGITGTPVIDPSTGTLFVVAKIRDTSLGFPQYAARLYALNIATGAARFGGPIDIQASFPGTGAGNDGAGNVPFNAFYGFQRPGLLLVNGVVYIGFASAGDEGPYHGWVIGYDAKSLQQVQVFNDSPNAGGGGIWMSGGAPAADAAGNIYFTTGNGQFDANNGGADYGDSFVKLQPGPGRLVVADYFTPYDQAWLDSVDGDLGSGAPMLLPDSAGSTAHPHLLLGGGKEGIVYLLDRDDLGHYNPANNNQIVQSIDMGHGIYGMSAFFDHTIYVGGAAGDALKAYSIFEGRMSSSPVSQTSVQFGYPGPTPSVSAAGTNNAIVWVLQTDAFNVTRGPAILRAYNATNLSAQLYSSTDAGPRDQLGLAQKFAVPTIANGKVYVGTGFGLSVFANLHSPVITRQPQSQTAEVGAYVLFSVTATGAPPVSYQWQHNEVDIPDAIDPTLFLPELQTAAAGVYTVVVTNAVGSVTSIPAVLVVNPPGPPQLSINARLELTLHGQPGQVYSIQYNSDLGKSEPGWVTLLTVTLPNRTQTLTDPELANGSQRFYRALVGAF